MNMNTSIAWAQALLAFPNLAFAAIDTTSLQDDTDILRIALMDGQGTVLLDRLIRPQRQPGQANTGCHPEWCVTTSCEKGSCERKLQAEIVPLTFLFQFTLISVSHTSTK